MHEKLKTMILSLLLVSTLAYAEAPPNVDASCIGKIPERLKKLKDEDRVSIYEDSNSKLAVSIRCVLKDHEVDELKGLKALLSQQLKLHDLDGGSYYFDIEHKGVYTRTYFLLKDKPMQLSFVTKSQDPSAQKAIQDIVTELSR